MSAPRIKLGSTLFLLGMVGVAAVFPYAFSTVGAVGMPLSVVWPFIAMQIIVPVVLLLVCIAMGMALSRPLGLGAPYLARLFGAEAPPLYVAVSDDGTAALRAGFFRTVLFAALTGAAVAALALAADVLLFGNASGRDSIASFSERIFAVLYGGINEEILMRFFLLSAVAWLLRWAERRQEPGLSRGGAWSAVFLTAALSCVVPLLFREPAGTLDAAAAARIIVLNGLPGMIYGWLYWKRGLEAAMAAHGTTDLLLVILPQFLLRIAV